MRGLLVACRYLTVLPLPRSGEAGDLGRAAAWFPVVGVVLGLLLAAAARLVELAAPPLVTAALVVTVWVAVTGGLHLDGLADSVDGLAGGWTREDALAIMRDARTGAYGVTAIVLALGLKIAALASVPPDARWRALIVAPVAGRFGPLLLARLCPPAREEGAGHAFALAVRASGLTMAALVTIAVSLGLLGVWGALLVALAAALAGAFAAYLRARLGGLTGDCLGALVEATEAGGLAVVAALAYLGRV